MKFLSHALPLAALCALMLGSARPANAQYALQNPALNPYQTNSTGSGNYGGGGGFSGGYCWRIALVYDRTYSTSNYWATYEADMVWVGSGTPSGTPIVTYSGLVSGSTSSIYGSNYGSSDLDADPVGLNRSGNTDTTGNPYSVSATFARQQISYGTGKLRQYLTTYARQYAYPPSTTTNEAARGYAEGTFTVE